MNTQDLHRVNLKLIRVGRITFFAALLLGIGTSGIEFLVLMMNPEQRMYEVIQDGESSIIFSSDGIELVQEGFPASEVNETAPYLDVPLIAGFLALPFLLLLVGGWLRLKANHVIDVWVLLDKHGEMTVEDIEKVTGQDRSSIGRSFERINGQGTKLFNFDRKRDSYFKSRYAQESQYIERCHTCDEPIGEKIRFSPIAPEKCPYCRNPLFPRDGSSSVLQS
jgi:hypothetical protein